MTSRKTRSFRHESDPEQPSSFWRRLFGGKPVQKEKLVKPAARPAAKAPEAKGTEAGPRTDTRPLRTAASLQPMANIPAEARPRNPKSFLAKKFNSQVVKAALLDAIGEAMDRPPPGIDPIESKYWIEGLAFKGTLVERLDCAALKPDEHLRAIQWMAKVEKAHPIKATYREDLFGLKFQLDCLHLQEPPEPPEAVAQGGVALRRLYQVIKTKLEGLGNLSGEASTVAQREIEAYERLMEAIERAPIALLDKRQQLLLSNVFRRIDPYKIELTTRNARFDHNVAGLVAELDEIYSAATASAR